MSRAPGRALARCALVLPVLGALVLGTALPASATIGGVQRGEVITTPRSLSLTADFGPSAPDNPPRLTITEPGGGPVVVASAEPNLLEVGQLNYMLDTQCWVPTDPSATCRTARPGRNGVWRVVQTGSGADSLTFTLAIAPQAPRGVVAEAASPTEMRVSWRRGAEPDLVSYTVFEAGQAARDGLAPADVCAETGLCSAVVTYPTPATGSHTYSVRAFRSDGAAGVLPSPSSSEASGDLSFAPPSPNPSAESSAPGAPGAGDLTPAASGTASPGAPGDPSPGSSASARTAGPGTAATGGGGAADAAAKGRKAFSLGFNSFGPKLGIPKLPPLPAAPPAPTVAKLPDGTFEPTLGFADSELVEPGEPEAVTATGASQRVSAAVGGVLDSEQLARSTAGALILLLAGGHLRRWLSDSPED